MTCYTCDRPATQRCARCGNDYCEDHGADLCASCLDPLSAAPSRGIFRMALAGLLVGSVLALWLLVRPPSVPGESSGIIRTDPSATPALTPQGNGQPSSQTATVTPGPGTPVETASPAPAATAEPTAPPAGPIQYTVVEGDTWNGIAEAFGIDAAALAATNGLALDYVLQPGDVLAIPQ